MYARASVCASRRWASGPSMYYVRNVRMSAGVLRGGDRSHLNNPVNIELDGNWVIRVVHPSRIHSRRCKEAKIRGKYCILIVCTQLEHRQACGRFDLENQRTQRHFGVHIALTLLREPRNFRLKSKVSSRSTFTLSSNWLHLLGPPCAFYALVYPCTRACVVCRV